MNSIGCQNTNPLFTITCFSLIRNKPRTHRRLPIAIKKTIKKSKTFVKVLVPKSKRISTILRAMKISYSTLYSSNYRIKGHIKTSKKNFSSKRTSSWLISIIVFFKASFKSRNLRTFQQDFLTPWFRPLCFKLKTF